MHRISAAAIFVVGLALLMFVGAQQAICEEYQAGTAAIGPPVKEQLSRTAPAPLSAQKEAELEYWSQNTGLPGPLTGIEAPVAGPIPGTETVGERQRSMVPMLPETPTLFRNVNFSSIVPVGYASHVMESSVATEGKNTFYTGNWFAARSINGGTTWAWVDPFPGFPSYSSFCFDQIAIPDKARTRIFWERMSSPGHNPSANFENVFKLSVSADGGVNWVTYEITPTNVNAAWTNMWWDYCHIQLGARYMLPRLEHV